MKSLGRIFIRGLLTLLPIGLSLYLIYLFFTGAENLARRAIVWGLGDVPEGYITGTGVVLGLVVIFLVGGFISSRLGQWFLTMLEAPFQNVPILKSIYGAIKDLTQYFSPEGNKKKSGQVVAVKHPDYPVELVGFMTRDSLNNLPKGLSKQGKVAVYLPMSYQIGGYTLFVPKDWVTKLDCSVEEAMRSTLTAWVSAN